MNMPKARDMHKAKCHHWRWYGMHFDL